MTDRTIRRKMYTFGAAMAVIYLATVVIYHSWLTVPVLIGCCIAVAWYGAHLKGRL